MSYNPFAGVQSFNSRQGVVVLTSSDVTGALDFTPANKAGETFTGKVNTPASATAGAGFNIAPGAAPTSPVDGDIWVTTSAITVRINTLSYNLARLSGNETVGGSWTFQHATLVFGNSALASTTSLASGATSTGNIKTVNVGTGGVAGSTTNVTVGSSSGGTSNILLNGEVAITQSAETTKAAAATLTAAEIRTGIISYTGGAANLTLPTGTALDTGFPFLVPDTSIEFAVINTGSGTATMVVNTGVTSLGGLTIAVGASGLFRLRKTGTATYLLYRLC